MLKDGCLQDSSWVSFGRCCMIRSYLDRSFGGYYGSRRKFPNVIRIERHSGRV
jgi:hypothetical protein